MRPVVTVLVVVYLLIGLFMSIFGAFRYPVLERADGEYRRDRIENIRLAHIGVDDALHVCVDGRYDDEQQEFWIRIPVMRMATDPGGLEAEAGYTYIDYLTTWRIPRSSVTPAPCGESPVDPARALAIRTLTVEHTENIFLHLDLTAVLADDGPGELVFELRSERAGEESLAGLAYGNEALDFSGRDVFRVTLEAYFVPGSKTWLLLLPFAWALDVLLWPYVLYMWTSYAGAH